MILLLTLACSGQLSNGDTGPANDSGVDSVETVGDDTAPDDTADSGDTSPPDSDADGSADSEDCEDTNPAVYPGAFEGCDGVDQDCDGVVDEACTTALSGDVVVESAQARLNGPCPGAGWGGAPILLDLDRDGVEEVLESVVCEDGIGKLVGSRFPLSGTASVDGEVDSVLIPSSVYVGFYYHASVPVDVDHDGHKDLLSFATYWDGPPDDHHLVQLFRTPTWGMTTDDADLTVEVIPQGTYAGGVTEDWTAALIPGDPGAVVVASSWLGDYDWATGATWVVPADASGWVTTDSVLILGPEAGQVSGSTFFVNDLADAGDINGDGENELYLGGGDIADLYMGPLAPSTGDRAPDFRLGGDFYTDGDYAGRTCTGGVTLVGDTDGDGTDNLFLVCYHDPYTSEAYYQGLLPVRVDSSTSVVLDDASPLVVAYPQERLGDPHFLDFNGDDVLDLVVATEGADVTTSREGITYIEYGPFAGTRELGSESGARILGSEEDMQLGAGLAVSDLNGDTYDDLIVGAGWGSSDDQLGSAWLFLGGP